MPTVPDDVPDRLKDLLRRKGSISEEEFEKELFQLYTCNEGCPHTGCSRMCLRVLGHAGEHYCVAHGDYD
jgi:hypothetical protein